MFAHSFNFAQDSFVSLIRNQVLVDALGLRGQFKVQHFRKGALLKEYDFPNDIVNVGKNRILDVMFANGTVIAQNSWFLGLISLTGFTGESPTDTMSSHAGWTEFISYTQANRVAWGQGAASGQSITNASAATFSINAGGTVKGIFLTSDNIKSGTGGLLWATALFSADVPVVSSDEIRATYTVNT